MNRYGNHIRIEIDFFRAEKFEFLFSLLKKKRKKKLVSCELFQSIISFMTINKQIIRPMILL